LSEVTEKFKPLFEPRSIAFVGATTNSQKWGYMILSQLLSWNYEGKIYAINPNGNGSILGLDVFPNISSLPESPDLAVIVTPRDAVLDIIKECVARRVRAGLIITSGFAEIAGEEGREIEREITNIAQESGMIFVGPNSNGMASPPSNLSLIMSGLPMKLQSGSLGITSRSGSVGTSLVVMATLYGVGYSRFISNGNEACLHIEDYIEYLGEDPETKVIAGYTEGIQDERRFLEVAQKVVMKKPLIMLMAGGTEAGAKAARYHTASFYGEQESFYEMACKQAGIIRTNDIHELFYTAATFLRQPLPRGRRVGILTIGGGWGVIAGDTCARAGLEVVEFPEETYEKMEKVLPWWWSRNNPVDTVTSMSWRPCLEAMVSCPVVDMVLVLWVSGKRIPGTEDVCSVVDELIEQYHKPIVFCNGGYQDSESIKEMGERQLVPCTSVSQAVENLAALASYSEHLSLAPGGKVSSSDRE
jgi:acetyltransferase